MKKRMISLLLIVVLLLSLPLCAFADSPANEARNGVVRIVEWITEDGDYADAYIGSAFFVGKRGENPRYLVTNHHMIEEYLENGRGEDFSYRDNWGVRHVGKILLSIFFDSETAVEAYVVDYDENQDIALLKLERATDRRVPLPMEIPDESMVGDAVYVVGYPGVADDAMNPTSTWGVTDALVTKGTVGRLVTESGSGTKWIQSSDLNLSGGNSGGPLVTEDGAVIGVVSKKMEDNSLTMCVNSEAVIQMLRKNAVPFDTVESLAEAAAAASAPAAEDVPAEPEKSGGFSPVWIALIALAAAVVVAGLILAGKKKKSKAKIAPDQDDLSKTVAAARPVKAQRPMIRSLAAQHSNQKVQIPATSPVTIGRSRDCTIVFQDGTPGVSGRHCTVSWDDGHGEFIVRDIGSTYGTFLDSGMQLEVNKPYRLRAGESFYLGERANTLRLEVE